MRIPGTVWALGLVSLFMDLSSELVHALAALSKPLFPLADAAALVATARFMDRVGKGIRGAPRCRLKRRASAGATSPA